MKYFFAAILFVVSNIYGQTTDWKKWDAKQISYELISNENDEQSLKTFGFASRTVSAAKLIYKIFFSDLDGDNCPFYPSCSQFYVDAVDETNILNGTLMFVDRFTRDINFFKGLNHYPKYSSNKFYDPAVNYSLNSNKINFNSPYNSD